MSNIQVEKSAIYGKVDAKKLSANNTIFKINVDFENSKAVYINSKESTQGVNNTLVLVFLIILVKSGFKYLTSSFKR